MIFISYMTTNLSVVHLTFPFFRSFITPKKNNKQQHIRTMAPPKKSSVDSTTTTNNFFTRGRKPTTTQRVVTAKKAFTATVSPKVQHRQRDEEDEDEVADEIEDAETDEDVEVHTPPQQEQVQQVGLGHRQQHQVNEDEDEDTDENDSLHEEVGDIHSGFHQADLSDSEKLLRQFDLASKYGPCTDMTRLERWERAFNLGLHPPQHIKDTLLMHSNMNIPLFEGRV
ncbi:MAG: DNA polymerase delta, subunit 4-domain-containing protein [Linnemannia gamsii]|nr:MAG: DNA polymerase delta, subunit 4-domain-containing protein [Linnemannia gamsii]